MTNTYPELKPSDRVTVACDRCGGSGIYTGPSNAKWENGSGLGERTYCFACGGAGTASVLVSSIRARIRREAKAAEARKAASERYAARMATFWTAERTAARDAATAAHIAMRDGDPLRRDLGDALELIESLDEAGDAALVSALAAIEARDAAKRAVPEGRVDIEGVLVSTKLVDSRFGSTVKALIEGDGWKVWGTLPRALDEAEKGARVAFTATVERSADDAAFGFYTRPTKARIVA